MYCLREILTYVFKAFFSFLIEDIFQALPHIIIVLVPDLKIKIKIKIIINLDPRDNIITEFPPQTNWHRNCLNNQNKDYYGFVDQRESNSVEEKCDESVEDVEHRGGACKQRRQNNYRGNPAQFSTEDRIY
jgi:hypothetical protein